MSIWSKKSYKKFTASALALAVMCSVSGCSDEKTNKLTYDGTWVAENYGQALKITGNKFTYYEFTPSFCRVAGTQNLTDVQFEALKVFWKVNNKQLRQRFTQHGIDFKMAAYDKKASLPKACKNPIPNDTDKVKAGALTEYAWFKELFDTYYPTFEQRKVDWQAVTSQNKQLIKDEHDTEGLTNAMVESIKPLRDGHVSVEKGDDFFYFTNEENIKEHNMLKEYIAKHGAIDSTEKQAAATKYVQEQSQKVEGIKLSYANADGIKTAFDGKMKWYVTPENVGVLIIDQMMGVSEESSFEVRISRHLAELTIIMPEVMKTLKNTNGLIIDVRENIGGIDGFSQYIARYFLDKPRDLYQKQYRIKDGRSAPEVYRLSPVKDNYTKPVALLTSGSTVSAAEIFVLMLRDLPHVTLAGKTTQGALSDVMSATLPSGIEVGLVNEYYTTMAGELFEVTGIPVDVDIPYATQQQRLEEKDEAYERFIKNFK